MQRRVVCYACGRVDKYPSVRCTCGEPLWFDHDVPTTWPEAGDRLWRYAEWLPVTNPGEIEQVAGGTPLVRTEQLDDEAGCRVSVKVETTNITGAFKDRGSAVGLAGTTGQVGTVSHGNMAMSMAAHAAASNRDCVVLVPANISSTRLGHIASHDPTIIRVDGDYGKLYHDTLNWDTEISFVNSDTPLRIAGQKTVALEICEAYAPHSPDAIVLPVSSGGHASAIWQALRELTTGGLLDTQPALYLVQASACAPIATAFRAGHDTVTPVDRGDTIAYSIANPDPPSGNRALAAVNDTDGAVIDVDDDAIRAAQRTLAEDAGLSVEPASATALAGLRELAQAETISPGDEVVMIATGTGFRTTPTQSVEPPVVPRADLQSALKSSDVSTQGNSYNPTEL